MQAKIGSSTVHHTAISESITDSNPTTIQSTSQGALW